MDKFAMDAFFGLHQLHGDELRARCHEILDAGDFQGNIPNLKHAIEIYMDAGNENKARRLMQMAASNGLKYKALRAMHGDDLALPLHVVDLTIPRNI